MGAPSRLSRQLVIAIVLPAILVLAGMGFSAELGLRRALEASLADALCAIASGGAQVVGPAVLALEPGEDDARAAQSARRKLEELLKATRVDRALVIRLDGTTALDSSRLLAVGDAYPRAALDRTELDRVAAGESQPSVLFEGRDRRRYKSCYAPIRERDSETVAGAFVVEGPASFFDVIDEMRVRLVAVVGAGFLALILLAAWAAKRVTVPLARLSDAARRIGAGELETQVPVDGPLEARVLAETMRSMALSLAERDREMQVMLAGIAHEVRNPLGGIELFGGLLKEDLEPSDPRSRHVDRILGEIRVLGGVVNDFLAFARKRPLEKQKVDLKSCFGELIESCTPLASEKSISIEVSVAPGILPVFDPNEVRRAVMNLVQNALQASPSGSKVVLKAERDSVRDQLRIEVIDQGPGVPDNLKTEIFRPFFTTKQKGTGLGLALVQKCAAAHGGSVEVVDAEPLGARFILSIPYLESAPEVGSVASGLVGTGELPTISSDDRIIVDDDTPAAPTAAPKSNSEPGLIDDDGTFDRRE